jgi:hypothetical protein
MALSNREKQQRWRERHIAQRRSAQRVASLLMRRRWENEHFKELAGELRAIMNTAAIVALRRALKPIGDEEMAAINRDMEKQSQALWLREHPGRTAAEYRRLLRNDASEVWNWRRAKNKATIAAEQAAWERDHPGEEYPEHECGLSDRAYTDLWRWRRQRQRAAKAEATLAAGRLPRN